MIRTSHIVGMMLLSLLLPGPAWALASLTCQGATPVGNLFETANACTGVNGLQNVFSGLVCDYQIIIDDIMSRVYCGVQTMLNQPLRVALVLYVMIFGLQILIGAVRVSTKEFLVRIVKIAFVWTFATEAAYGIGFAYNFFVEAMNEGISWILSVAMPPPFAPPPGASLCQFNPLVAPFTPERTAFRYVDYLICKTITGPLTSSGAMIAGFFGVMAFIAPPISAMFVYFGYKSITIFIRALLSYLLAMSVIALLITLSPIFLSLMLFRATYHFFDSWLRYIISFSLQVVLIFAGVALWITMLVQLGGFFEQLAPMLRPVTDTLLIGGVRTPVNTWGICNYNVTYSAFGPLFSCIAGDPIYPTELIERGPFLYFLILNMVSLCTVAYAFDALMGAMPGLAGALTGASGAIQIGGGLGGLPWSGKMVNPEYATKNSRDFVSRFNNLFSLDRR